jgi:hypothetical protein
MARKTRTQSDPQVLNSREAYGMTDSWQEYLCLTKTTGEAYKLFVGGYPPRSRKMRLDENYDALLFTENDNEAIQDWLDQTGWSSQTTVASIKAELKTL